MDFHMYWLDSWEIEQYIFAKKISDLGAVFP